MRLLVAFALMTPVCVALLTPVCVAQWRPTLIRQLDGDHAIVLPAERQDVSEGWSQITQIPYMVYMPEKDRVLMLLNRGETLHGMVLASDDHGATWSEPRYVRAGADGEPGGKSGIATGLTYLGNGRLMLHMGPRHWLSVDYGESWDCFRPIPPSTAGKLWHEWDPLLVDKDPATGAVTRLLSFCSDHPEPDGYFQGYVRFSEDEGCSWREEIRVPQWHKVNEVALIRAANGHIIAGCRTDNPDQYKDRIDHFGGLAVSISTDDGQTWSQPDVLYESGRHHPSLVLMPGGEIVMAYIVREGYPTDPNGFAQFGIEAVVSRDHGKTWNMANRYVLDRWSANSQGSLYYLWAPQGSSTVLLPGNSLLTAYSSGYRISNVDAPQMGPRDVGLVRWKLSGGIADNQLVLPAVKATVAPPRGVIKLMPGSQLFIDDYLIEASMNLTRTTHQPQTLPNPILAKDETWHEMPLFYQQVLRDPDSGLFRMWYNVRNNTPDFWTCFAYAESDDGIHWRRPRLGLVEVNGSKANNIYWKPNGIAFGLMLVDDGKQVADPNRRFKMAYSLYGGKTAGGIHVAFSPDGIRFTVYDQNPVLADEDWDDSRGRYHDYTDTGDIMDGCWDPFRKRYLMAVEVRSAPEDRYQGKNFADKEFFRLVAQSVSDDFIHWSVPARTMVSDPNEAGLWEFYGMKPQVRGNLYLGFVRILRDDVNADPDGPGWGIGWTELSTSRDGENWTRYREPFLDRNPQPGTFDHAHAWVGDCVTVGDKEFIYYCGYAEGHKVGTRQNGLGFLRKDGFVSRDAGTLLGHLRTPVIIFDGAGLTVNAEVEGELRVRILDPDGKSLAGFGWDDCQPIRGDSVRHPVQWSGNLADLKDTPIRLEFALRKAKLYAFDLAP